MTPSEAAIAGAVIAAVIALIGVIATTAVALHNETRRRRAAVSDARRLALRSAAAEVFVHIFHVQHEMEWLTWHAVHRPKAVDQKMTAAYEAAVHAAYPKILGAMATLAALDLDLYHKVAPLLEILYSGEANIGREIGGLAELEQRTDTLDGLAALHEFALDLYRSLPPKLAEAMQEADRRFDVS